MEGNVTATTIPSFNPSNDARVAYIKDRIEALIKHIREYGDNEADPRCKAIALTKLEEASMWAVKSLFVKEPGGGKQIKGYPAKVALA